MLKQLGLLTIVAMACLTLTGCVGASYGITGAQPGLIYTNCDYGLAVSEPVRPLKEKYKVVSTKAQGEATATNILGLVSVGDSSLYRAKKEAIKNMNADELIDYTIDVRKDNILFMFTHSTLKVRGTAIRYTK